MKVIESDIKQDSYKPVYLLYGEELYLKSLYKNKLKRTFIEKCGELNVMVYSDKVEEKQIIENAKTPPMFAEYRVMFFNDSGFFKNKTDKLPDLINSMPESLILIFCETEVDKRNRMYKAVSKSGHVAEFKRQPMASLEKWVQSIIAREGKNITQQDIRFLLERTGDDMGYIATEVEKLICYNLKNEKISRESILAITDERIENKIFDMITAITEQRQRDALEMYSKLLILKEPPLRILYLIARQYNILLMSLAMHNAKLSNDDIAAKLGLQSFVIRKSLPIAKKYSVEYLRAAVEEIVEMETNVKTGKITDSLSVELLIIKYSSRENKSCVN